MLFKRGLYLVLILLICLPFVYSFDVPGLPPPLPGDAGDLPAAPPVPGVADAQNPAPQADQNVDTTGSSNGGHGSNPWNHTYSEVYNKYDNDVKESTTNPTAVETSSKINTNVEGDQVYSSAIIESEGDQNIGWVILIVISSLALLGVGGYFGYNYFFTKSGDETSSFIIESKPVVALILVLIITLSGIVFVYFGSNFIGQTFRDISTESQTAFSDAKYNNYAPPWDAGKELKPMIFALRQDSNLVYNDQDRTVQIKVDITHINGLIFGIGYIFTSNGWKEIQLQGNKIPDTNWIQGVATYDGVLNVDEIGLDLIGDNFIVVYTCEKDATGNWKCGCRDQSCTQDRKWRVQTFTLTKGEAVTVTQPSVEVQTQNPVETCVSGNVKAVNCVDGRQVEQKCVNSQWEDLTQLCNQNLVSENNVQSPESDVLLDYNFDSEGAIDLSGNGHDGVVKSATYCKDCGVQGSGAYSFDAVDDSLGLNVVRSTGPEYTICGWIFPNKLNRNLFWSKGTDKFDSKSSFVFATITPAVVVLSAESKSVYTNCQSNRYISQGWNFICFTNSGKVGVTRKIYINGVDATGPTNLACTVKEDLDGTIGSLGYLGSYYTSSTFDGIIDETKVWNRVLSPEEIATLYKSKKL